MICRVALVGAVLSALASADSVRGADAERAAPVVEGVWMRPAVTTGPAIPLWGHASGMRVGIWPTGGPRGLLRVFTPYAGQPESRLINFIAVEPVPADADGRGYSELEKSGLDERPGKRFWSADGPADPTPREPDRPARGVIETIDGVEQLSVHIPVERFDNGAHVYLKLLFRADLPHEVGISVFTHSDSKPLRECVITATMGNFARLRRLELADGVEASLALWPDYRGDGFTRHRTFGLERMSRLPEGDAVVSATPDEPQPTTATYADGTASHWRYVGDLARQRWRMPSPPASLRVGVNGRFTYWASRSPIPGGVSFENFELIAPFEQSQTFWFGVERMERPAGDSATTRPTQP